MKTDMVQKVMMMEMIWMVALTTANAIATMDVGIDILGGGLTSLGASPSLSKPHDQPYPTQPYITKLSQFHNFTNCDTNPLRTPNGWRRGRRHGKRNAMSGPPYNGATIRHTTYDRYDVRRTTGTMYDVRRVRCTTYDSMTWSHPLSKHVVSK